MATLIPHKNSNLNQDLHHLYAKILIYDIDGKREARRIERQYIDNYVLKHGRKPRGNPRY